jgi:hypothetical protein
MRYKKTTIILISLSLLGILLAAVARKHVQQPPIQNPLPAVVPITSSTTSLQASSTAEVKTYHNEEFGFEFQYPKSWKFEENSFGSPFSKFNLEGDSSAKDYNPDMAALLINVVTPDFTEGQYANLKSVAQKISVGGVAGEKYEYIFESIPQVDIILPLGQYKIILGTAGRHIDIFNQIVATFKFLK